MQGIDLQRRFLAHRGVAWFTSFSPSSPLLATGGSDELVKLWNLDTKVGHIVLVLRGRV